MKRWHDLTSERKENEKVDLFLKELFELYEKHNMSISHEDCHGGFEIDALDDYNQEWIKEASVTRKLCKQLEEEHE